MSYGPGMTARVSTFAAV